MKKTAILSIIACIAMTGISKAQDCTYDNIFSLKNTAQRVVPVDRKFSIEFENLYDAYYTFNKPIIADTSVVSFDIRLYLRPTDKSEPTIFVFTSKKKGYVRIIIPAKDSEKKDIVVYDKVLYIRE
jgi:hypothetical protein